MKGTLLLNSWRSITQPEFTTERMISPAYSLFPIVAACKLWKEMPSLWITPYTVNGVGQRLKESLADKIQAKSSTDKTRLESFFGRPELPTPTPTTTLATPTPAPANISSTSKKIYEDCVVSVSAWPRPTQMRMTPELIRLCSNLTKRPAHFERILALKLCSSNEKLTHYLSVLESLGLLKTHSSVGVPNLRVVSNPSISANTAEQPVNKTADRFSRVLRRFIASAKS